MRMAKDFSFEGDGSIATGMVKAILEEQQPKAYLSTKVGTVAMTYHLHYCRQELFLCPF